MPECRVIPYFKGFLTELKEILSLGGTCTGNMLGDLNDFLREHSSSTMGTTAGGGGGGGSGCESVNNNNFPGTNLNSLAHTGVGGPTPNHTASVNSSSGQPPGLSNTNNTNYLNNNNNNNNSSSGTFNKNFASTGDPNCVKRNNIGPSKSTSTGTTTTESFSGPCPSTTDSLTTRGMQTVNLAARSPQDQRREMGHSQQKNLQQKVVSFIEEK